MLVQMSSRRPLQPAASSFDLYAVTLLAPSPFVLSERGRARVYPAKLLLAFVNLPPTCRAKLPSAVIVTRLRQPRRKLFADRQRQNLRHYRGNFIETLWTSLIFSNARDAV